MTIHRPILHSDIMPPLPGLLIEAIRCWRDRRVGISPCHRLHMLLAEHGLGMLAPAFDSLFTCYETVISRSISIGANAVSSDEARLLELVSAAQTRPTRAMAGASMLRCAAMSVAFMIRHAWEAERPTLEIGAVA